MKLHRSTALAALAAAVSIAAASEGQAGGGTEITSCGQVVTTNAFLTHDRYCPGSTGVVVGAAGITIDLKGFTLRGDRSLGHYGIDDTAGFDGVTVKNGVVRNFYYGIWAQAVEDFSVTGVLASGNAGNGIDIDGAGASVKSSSASGNGNHGLVIGNTSAKVQSVTAVGNADIGILATGAGASVKSSTASGNGFFGIDVNGDGASVKSSTASGNANLGIYVLGDAAAVSGNRAEANGYSDGDTDGGHGLGIVVTGFTTPPTGRNVALGNDDPAECDPSSLCSAPVF
jgi:large repetitive protein